MPEPQLDRQGRRMARPAGPFLGLAALVAIIGVILLIVTSLTALGIVLIALSLPLLAVAGGLLTAGGVSRWAARRKPFA